MARLGSTAAVLIGALCVLCTPRSARAQHGTAGYTVVPMNPYSGGLLEVQTAGFELGERSGVWQVLGVRLEHEVARGVSVALRPGLARVEYDGGQVAFGPADTELVVKLLALERFAPHTTLSLGLSGEVPTGDPDDGTGNGHVSLFPFAVFMVMPSKAVMVHLMAGDRVVLAEADHHDGAAHDAHAGHAGHEGHVAAAHGSVIMPHSEHELAAHGGARFFLGQFAIAPGLELMQVFSPGSATFLNAQLELGLVPRHELRLAAAIDLPLLEDRRFTWRSRIAAAWVW